MTQTIDMELFAKRVKEQTAKEIFEELDKHFYEYNPESKRINFKEYERIKSKFIK